MVNLLWFLLGWLIGWAAAKIQSNKERDKELDELESVCYELTDNTYRAIQQETHGTLEQYKKWMEDVVDVMDYSIEEYFHEIRSRNKKRIF